jgi:DNA-binding NarL/FixJ family response regulator
MLHQVQVFIAEDELIIGLSLASFIADARGTVLGPAASVREALSVLEKAQPHVGVLDFHLRDGESTPVAALLARRGIPIVFHCADLPWHMKARHPKARCCLKPSHPATIIGEIAMLLGLRGN